MIEYDAILLPVDGSDRASVAYDHAASLAARYDATLHACYVVNTTYSDVGAAGDTTRSSLRDRGTDALEGVRERGRSDGVAVETHLVEGDPFREIRDLAADVADLIVMATRGRSGIDRYLLGSVTEKVVRTSEVPVFTVRAAGEE